MTLGLLWHRLVQLVRDAQPMDAAKRVDVYRRLCAAPVIGVVGHRLTCSGAPDADQVKRRVHLAHLTHLMHELRPGDDGVVRVARKARARRRPGRVVTMAQRRTA